MIHLDIDYFPFIFFFSALLQCTLCLVTPKSRLLRWICPVAYLTLSFYGIIADQARFPYPPFFAPDFMLSSAYAGFLFFGTAFIGTIIGLISYHAIRHLKGGN